MDNTPKRAPVEQAERAAQAIARMVEHETPSGYGFVLFLASMGSDGYLTYVSNLDRESSVLTVREWLSSLKVRGFEDYDLSNRCSACGASSLVFSTHGPAATVHLCAACYGNGRAS